MTTHAKVVFRRLSEIRLFTLAALILGALAFTFITAVTLFVLLHVDVPALITWYDLGIALCTTVGYLGFNGILLTDRSVPGVIIVIETHPYLLIR
jgi:hypothetical protein